VKVLVHLHLVYYVNNGSKFHYGVASVPKEEVDSNALYSVITNYS